MRRKVCQGKEGQQKVWNIFKKCARKNLTDFSAYEPVAVRKDEEFLSDDVSIIIAYNKKKKEHMDIVSLLSFTNINILPFSDEIPVEVISFLDPTV